MQVIWESTIHKTPEQMLWINVIILFLRDTQIDYNKYRVATNGDCAMLLNKVKHNVLSVEGDWMEIICDNADVDYTKLCIVIKKISRGEMDLGLPSKGRWY